MINLSKESQADRVQRPWDMEVKVGDRPCKPLPQDKTVVDVFDDEAIGGKLLILGQPGAGKTTTLLSLAEALQVRANKDAEAPMPVLFNLSKWRSRHGQDFSDWLVEQLESNYKVIPKLGQDWLRKGKILPLLDSLDEVSSERQEAMHRVNAWLKKERPGAVVVCSRIENYERYEEKLELNGAVCLQPLSDGQIADYLGTAGKLDLGAAVARDEALRELVRVPLYVSMTVLVYDEAFRVRWRAQDTAEKQLGLLLEAYVARRLKDGVYPGKRQPSEKQTKIWLIWLAEQLRKESKGEFLIEQIQPTLLATTEQKQFYRLLVRLIVGLSIGLIVGLSIGLTGKRVSGPIWGLSIGLMAALMVEPFFVSKAGLVFDLMQSLIFPADKSDETDELYESEFVKSFEKWLTLAIKTGTAVFSLITGLIVPQMEFPERSKAVKSFEKGLALAIKLVVMVVLAIVGLIFVPMSFLEVSIGALEEEIRIRVKPNQGILQACKHALIWTGAVLLISLLLPFTLKPFLAQWLDASLAARVVATSQACLIWFSFQETGGKACIQHFALRLVLWHTGQIPCNYARFLNHCTDRLLLQRVGGGYRFIHKRLQDHFAELP